MKKTIKSTPRKKRLRRMTPAQINIAIAKLCGYVVKEHHIRQPHRTGYSVYSLHAPDGMIVDNRESANEEAVWSHRHLNIPDYYHSLDACAKFEATLQNMTITSLTAGNAYELALWDGVKNQCRIIFTPADEKCWAFLRLHGNWGYV